MIENLDEKYTNTGLYVVTFVDVLGVKNKIKNNCKETLEQLWLINNFIQKEAYQDKDIIIRTFSDNYFIAIKTSENDLNQNFQKLLNLIGNLQNMCLRLFNVLLRGAITSGEMHIDENTILGEALIKAYKFEQDVAVYPRIIVDEKYIQRKNLGVRDLTKPLFIDVDLEICLNPLLFCKENQAEAFKTRLMSNIATQIIEAQKSKDNRVISKINWIVNYVNEYYWQNYKESLFTDYK